MLDHGEHPGGMERFDQVRERFAANEPSPRGFEFAGRMGLDESRPRRGVKIKRGDIESVMETRIWRNGSCAHCHGPQPDESSMGRVFLDEEATP